MQNDLDQIGRGCMMKHNDRIGWGLLLILWGITILFDFVPFGAGVLGTGLILLGVNLVRKLNGLPPRDDNNVLGLLAITWGGLEMARPALQQVFAIADWDWAIFAILLLVLGMILLGRGLLRTGKTGVEKILNHE
jgi:hypothetical protein